MDILNSFHFVFAKKLIQIFCFKQPNKMSVLIFLINTVNNLLNKFQNMAKIKLPEPVFNQRNLIQVIILISPWY